MESLKGKFSELIKYLEDSIKPFNPKNYQFIESQRNVFYFSKFTIDPNDLYQIFLFIWQIKVNIFKKMLQLNVQTINSLLYPQVPLMQDKEKIHTLFSLCYIHYYCCFQYETNNTFEQYYNTYFAFLLHKYNIIIKNEEQLKTFSYQFFINMHIELERLKNTEMYKKIQLLCKVYNPNLFNSNANCNSKSSILTQLVAAKEHIIDMVIEKNMIKKFNSKAIHDEINFMMNRLSKVVRESYIKEIVKSSNPQITPSIEEPMKDIGDSSVYSKRLLSELIRCEVDPPTEKMIREISRKIDETMLDQMINKRTNCSINLIKNFVCYNIEIDSDLIRTIPEYKDLQEDITVKFIVPAKDIYNKFAEVYFSLYDLVFTDFSNLKFILDKQGFPAKFYNSAHAFSNGLSFETIKQKINIQENMNQVIGRFIDNFFNEWEATIKESGQKLTHFCLI